jgi:hypothetical protein
MEICNEVGIWKLWTHSDGRLGGLREGSDPVFNFQFFFGERSGMIAYL